MMQLKIIFRNIKYNEFNNFKFTCEKRTKFYLGSFYNMSIRCFTKKNDDNFIEELKERGLVDALTRLHFFRKFISTFEKKISINIDLRMIFDFFFFGFFFFL